MTTPSPPITPEQSGAFVERFELAPTGSGSLDGLTFAVKDLMDVAGYRTGCGNPTWRDTHPPAIAHAVCVEQLLAAGARCVGKTVTDELAFSLLGVNHFYGTPLNAKAPDRLPGGSSSGSASAVACGWCDFALGTDTGGSVRVPASNCGILGWRPTYGLVSLAGVMPLAPGFDTVGVFARDAEVLGKAAEVLLASGRPADTQPGTLHLLREGFSLADAEVAEALRPATDRLRERFGGVVRETALAEVVGDPAATDFLDWFDTYRVLMGAETWSSLGAWVEAAKPAFGPKTALAFELASKLDRRLIPDAAARRERYARRLRAFLGARDVLVMPTTPTLVPRKTDDVRRDQGPASYFPRTLGYTAVAGIGRLPQVSLPLGESDGVPVGLSLIGAPGSDLFLLELARRGEPGV